MRNLGSPLCWLQHSKMPEQKRNWQIPHLQSPQVPLAVLHQPLPPLLKANGKLALQGRRPKLTPTKRQKMHLKRWVGCCLSLLLYQICDVVTPSLKKFQLIAMYLSSPIVSSWWCQYGSLSLLLVMKVTVWHFIGKSHSYDWVIVTLPSKCSCGDFSVVSWI